MRRKIQTSKRKSAIRKANKSIVIVCEGEKTERIYFNNFRGKNSAITIKIPNTKHTDAPNLLHFAKSLIDELNIDFKYGDRIWCVIDVDNTDEDIFRKIREFSKRHKIGIALSNPSFEVWYLLHFEYSTASYLNCAEATVKLRRYIPAYDKNKCFFAELLDSQEDALKHAKKINQHHVTLGNELISRTSNPSSQVYEIVEYIKQNS